MSNLSLGVELFLTTLFLFLLNFFQVLFSLVMKDNTGKRLQHEYQLLLEAKSQQKKVSLKQSQKLNSSFFSICVFCKIYHCMHDKTQHKLKIIAVVDSKQE